MNPSAPHPALRLRDVTVAYQAGFALHPLSLELPAGARCAVLGANGAGKSTLLRLIGGLLRPRSGTIELFGSTADQWTRAERAKRVAGLPGEADTPLPLTVRELVSLGRSPHEPAWGPPAAGSAAEVDTALAQMELLPLAEARLDRLSAGERQRAFLALTLAQRAELVLLDEPTAHLDLRHAVRFMQILVEQADARGLTSIFSTHDLQRAADAATHVALMKAGRLLAFGLCAEVLTGERLSATFDTPIVVHRDAGRNWIRAG